MKQFTLVLIIAFLFTGCDALVNPQTESTDNEAASSQNQQTKQGSWQHQDSGTETGLTSVHFVDEQTGWVVGHNGIFYTNDGGENWQQQSGITAELNSVFFVNERNGWAVGDSTILHTGNGGESWQRQCKTSQDLNSVYFTDAQNGWAVSDSAVILHTGNGGKKWSTQFVAQSDDAGGTLPKWLNAVHFIDDQTGWAVGGRLTRTGPPESFAVRTTDGGESWSSNYAGFAVIWPPADIYFTDQDHGWVAGQVPYVEESLPPYIISRTENGGESWTARTAISTADTAFSAVHFVNPERGWMVGQSGVILHSTDGGESWQQQESGIDENLPEEEQTLRDVYFVNESNGWAIGNNGQILHYSTEE